MAKDNNTIDDRVLRRRQKDLDNFIEGYQGELDKMVAQHAENLRPTWKRIEKSVRGRVKQLYKQIGAIEDPKKLNNLKKNAERLEQLADDIANDIKHANDRFQPYYTKALEHGFEKSYYMHSFGLEQASKVAVQTPLLTKGHVLGVLANPWLPDGATYSDRLRGNTAYLAEKMRETVSQAVTYGWDWNKAARRIEEVTGEGYHNAVRLIRTELNRASALGASYTYMNNADIMDGKRWNATLDARTAPKDAANDGKKYPLDYDTPENPGIPGQRIPNHPNCRCNWSPILSALGINDKEKIAREGGTPSSFGKRTYVEAENYKEYAKKKGLPDLDDRLENDNLKRYLRPGETLEDINQKVKQWTYNGNKITVPKPDWDEIKDLDEAPGVKAVQYRPVDSIRAANSWAKENIDIDHIKYNSFDIRLANECNEYLASLQREYPEVFENTNWFTTAQARNREYYNRKVEKMKKMFMEDGLTEEDALEMAEDYVKRKQVNGRVYAISTGDKWDEELQGISFNKKWASDYDKFSKSVARNAKNGWHPEGTEDVTSVLTHEFGHRIDKYLRENNKRSWVMDLYKQLQDEVSQTGKGIKGYRELLSEYGNENSSEFFAEAFAEWVHNDNPRKWATKVGEKLEETLSELRGSN